MARTGRPRTIETPPLRAQYGRGIIVAHISINGDRACLLLCECGGEYACLLRDLVRGKVTSCGSCAWERRVENRQHEGARQAVMCAAEVALAGSDWYVAAVTLKRRE